MWRPSRTFYESGRDIGDEYRYILDRQSARKFPGNMLERPGLLLNPWALRDTETQAEVLAGGASYAGAAAAMPQAAAAAAAAEAAAAEPPEGYASLDFLKQPSVVLLNLVPDNEGRIRIPRGNLKGKPQLRILAVDPLTDRPERRCPRRHAHRDPRASARRRPGPREKLFRAETHHTGDLQGRPGHRRCHDRPL